MDNLLAIFENADPFRTWWPTIAAVLVGLAIMMRTIMSGQRCPNDNQIKEQIVIVTGGNSGIGFEIAKALAARGARIILACRDMQAGERAASIIKRELSCRAPILDAASTGTQQTSASTDSDGSTKSTSDSTSDSTSRAATSDERFFVEARYLDLRSFDSVQHFASQIGAEFGCVDVLVNNAGVIFQPTQTITVDGFEVHLQVNYLAHFLLTQLLLPQLRRSAQGRIVNVAAHAHAAAKIDFDDPLNVGTWSVKFHARDAFAHSKLAVILATRWLARELKDSTVTVNCLTPGLVRGTKHLRNSPLMSAICIKVITYPWMWLCMKNPFEGAQCAIRLATDPQLKHVTGEYFNDCDIALTSPAGQDKELAKKLYMQTMETLAKVTKLQLDVNMERKHMQ